MSSSPEAIGVATAGGWTDAVDVGWIGAERGFSSEEVEVAFPVPDRRSRILKSGFSSSNSASEFFFIKSTIALISFRSTRWIVMIESSLLRKRAQR